LSFLPHPLCPPLLQRRGGGLVERGFAPLRLPLFSGDLLLFVSPFNKGGLRGIFLRGFAPLRLPVIFRRFAPVRLPL